MKPLDKQRSQNSSLSYSKALSIYITLIPKNIFLFDFTHINAQNCEIGIYLDALESCGLSRSFLMLVCSDLRECAVGVGVGGACACAGDAAASRAQRRPAVLPPPPSPVDEENRGFI